MVTATTLPWLVGVGDGGISHRANLAKLCKAHHQLKHRHNLHYDITINGTIFWRFPDGRTYVVPPDGLPWYIGDDFDNAPPRKPTNQIIPRTRLHPEDDHRPIPLH